MGVGSCISILYTEYILFCFGDSLFLCSSISPVSIYLYQLTPVTDMHIREQKCQPMIPSWVSDMIYSQNLNIFFVTKSFQMRKEKKERGILYKDGRASPSSSSNRIGNLGISNASLGVESTQMDWGRKGELKVLWTYIPWMCSGPSVIRVSV